MKNLTLPKLKKTMFRQGLKKAKTYVIATIAIYILYATGLLMMDLFETDFLSQYETHKEVVNTTLIGSVFYLFGVLITSIKTKSPLKRQLFALIVLLTILFLAAYSYFMLLTIKENNVPFIYGAIGSPLMGLVTTMLYYTEPNKVKKQHEYEGIKSNLKIKEENNQEETV